MKYRTKNKTHPNLSGGLEKEEILWFPTHTIANTCDSNSTCQREWNGKPFS
jgi:hypothetical protein